MHRLLAPTVVLAALVSAAGCQNYDLEPVNPRGFRTVHVTTEITHLKARPDLMLMVDRSGSMAQPIDPANPACPVGCNQTNPCPAGCPTRWTELQGAMDDFLTQYGGLARMGLTQFAGPPPAPPGTDPSCIPGAVIVDTSNSNDIPSELTAQASQIDSSIGAIRTGLGTPTGPTLELLSTYAPLTNPDRDDYLLLLTDGLPNCNANNPNSYKDPATQAACRCTDPSSFVCDQSDRLLCLDKDNTVTQIGNLKEKGVKTLVVGFSSELTTGAGPEVLTAMGAAGGYKLTCPLGTDAECAGGRCNLADQTCSNTYYQASDRAALSAALARLAQTIDPRPCEHELPLVPTSAQFISVVVNGRAVPEGPDTWRYVPPKEVDLLGALCAQAEGTTETSPMDLSIGVIQTL